MMRVPEEQLATLTARLRGDVAAAGMVSAAAYADLGRLRGALTPAQLAAVLQAIGEAKVAYGRRASNRVA